MSDTAFYDPDAIVTFGTMKEMNIHFALLFYSLTIFLTVRRTKMTRDNDKNPNTCLDIGGKEQSSYVPTNE